MIYTLTTNPAIDMHINSNGPLQPSAVNRTHGASYSANGKGLNVSYVLKHYGVESKILGFFGGFSGHFVVDTFNQVHKIPVLPVWNNGNTRINVFLNDSKNEFNMVSEGPVVSKTNQKQLLQQIEDAQDIDCLSISGSLPRGIEPDYYDQIFEVCNSRDVQVIIDVSHKHLASLIKYRPFLIKPNDDEILDVFGWQIKTENDVVDVMRKLYGKGAQNILLTLGEKGLYFYNGLNLYFASVPPVKVLSSVCAGDSCLAAFIAQLLNQNKCSIKLLNSQSIPEESIKQAMICACATGANVAESIDIGTLSKVEHYMTKATFRKLP